MHRGSTYWSSWAKLMLSLGEGAWLCESIWFGNVWPYWRRCLQSYRKSTARSSFPLSNPLWWRAASGEDVVRNTKGLLDKEPSCLLCTWEHKYSAERWSPHTGSHQLGICCQILSTSPYLLPLDQALDDPTIKLGIWWNNTIPQFLKSPATF